MDSYFFLQERVGVTIHLATLTFLLYSDRRWYEKKSLGDCFHGKKLWSSKKDFFPSNDSISKKRRTKKGFEPEGVNNITVMNKIVKY